MERTFHMLLYRAFHAQRGALRPHLGELGLGTGQPKVLGYLIRSGPSRQRQLAEYCEVDPKGRLCDPADGRAEPPL